MSDDNPPQNRPVILRSAARKNPSNAARQTDYQASTDETARAVQQLPDEYDRRGVKLPARALIGGIITPA